MERSTADIQNGIRVRIHVIPNAKRTEMLIEPDGTITMRVNAPPAKGKANREIVKWLSKRLGRPSSHIRIVAGLGSHLKVVDIIGIDEKNFLENVRQRQSNSS